MRILLKVAQNKNKDHLSKLNSLSAKFRVQNRQVVILHRLNFQIFHILGQNLKVQITQIFGIFKIWFWIVLMVSIKLNQNFKWNSFQCSNLKTQNSYIYDKAFIPLVGNTLKLCICSHSDIGLKYIEQWQADTGDCHMTSYLPINIKEIVIWPVIYQSIYNSLSSGIFISIFQKLLK